MDGKFTYSDLGGDAIDKMIVSIDKYVAKTKLIIEAEAKLASGKLETSVNGASDSLKKATEAAKKMKTEQDKLTASTTTFAKALKAEDAAEAKLTATQKGLYNNTIKYRSETAKATKAVKDNQKAVNSAEGSYDQISAKLSQNLIKWKALSEQQRKNATVGGKLTKTINDQRKKLSDLDKQTGTATRGVGKYKEGIINAAKQMSGFTGGVAAAMVVLRSITRIFNDARETIRGFEKEFANVLTLLDEAQKAEFKGILQEGAVQIMAKYGLTLEDTNKALFDVISAGIPAGEALEFLDRAAQVAIAGNAELSDVIDGATTTFENYSKKGETSTTVLNAFFAAQVKGKTTVAALAANVGKVASTFAAADIPMNEMFGTLAGLTKAIGSTEESSTVLLNTVNALIKPTDEAEKVFQSLGIETGITAIKQDGLLNKVLEVAAAYEGNNDVLTELIPNIRAFKGIAALTPQAIAEIEKNILDLNDAEAATLLVQGALTEQMETATKEQDVLKQSTNALFIEIGGGESIFKRVGSAWRKYWTGEIQNSTENIDAATSSTRGFMDRVKGVSNIILASPFVRGKFGNFRFNLSEDTKAVEETSDAIVENAQETTTALTEEEKARQAKLSDIRKNAQAQTVETEKEFDGEYLTNRVTALQAWETEYYRVVDGILVKQKELETGIGDSLVNIQLKRSILTETEKQAHIDEQERQAQTKFAYEESKQAAIDSAFQVFEFGKAIGERRIADIEAQVAAGTKTEEQGAKEVEEIRKKQARASKAQALIDIAINTAVAISKVLGQTGIFGLAAWIPVAALGAVQTATVLATPAFEKGGHHEGGAMIANEAGRELFFPDKGGVQMLEGKGATIYNNAPSGTILPNDITERILNDSKARTMIALQSNTAENSNALYNELTGQIKGMRKDFRKQKSTTSGISKKGFQTERVFNNKRVKRVTRFTR